MAAPQPSFDPTSKWKNFHQTWEQKVKGRWNLHYPNLHPAGTTTDDLRETTRQIQSILAQAKAKGLRARAVGSHWSLSTAPGTDGWVINTNRLRGRMRLKPAQVHPSYPGTADQRANLFLFQCGNTVADVNELLESPALQRSLATTGAANGQTIVGATATGTHGSALDHGAIHDQIVALHLIAGDQRHYWLERQARPVASDAFIAALGATPMRGNDDLFDAAVMAFGSFGVIQAAVIETQPRFLLKTFAAIHPLDENLWKAIGGLDFSAHAFFKDRGRPYFFQAVINPNDKQVIVNANYKQEECPAGYVPNYSKDSLGIGPGFDTLSLVGRILDKFPKLIPSFAGLAAQNLVNLDPPDGTWGEVFGYHAPRLHVGSGTVAVALPDARRALETLIELYRTEGNVPLVFGCRYVRRSPALLAFNRFDPVTMVVSIDGVDSKRSRRFFAEAARAMEKKRIAYTQHWGKTNAYDRARIDRVYGGNVGRWLGARRTLLPDPADRALFANAYMEERGLAG